jgi:hypothetical protein
MRGKTGRKGKNKKISNKEDNTTSRIELEHF